jgi:hypothetical protein
LRARQVHIDKMVKAGPDVTQDREMLRTIEASHLEALQVFKESRQRIADRQEKTAREQHEKARSRMASERQALVRERALLSEARKTGLLPPASIERLRDQLRLAQGELRKIDEERRVVISELRRGAFCSKCKRSKYEIESSGTETFAQHLSTVGGTAILEESFIQEKELLFTKKLAEASGKIGRLTRQLDDAKAAYDKAIADRRRELDDREEQYDANLEENRKAMVAADSLLAERLAEAEATRLSKPPADFENEVQSVLDSLRKGIARKTAEHKEKIAKLRTEVAGIRFLEEALAEQLRWSQDPILRNLKAEQMADADIKREDRVLEMIDAVEKAVTTSPGDTAATAVENMTRAVLKRMGADSSETMKKQIEAEYRSRLIRKYQDSLEKEARSSQ